MVISVEEGCGFRRYIFLGRKNDIYKNDVGHGSQHEPGSEAVSCQNYLSWRFGGRNLHAPTGRIRGERKGKLGMPVEDKLVRAEASTLTMVLEV